MKPNELIELPDPRGKEYGYYASRRKKNSKKVITGKFTRDSILEFSMTFDSEKMFKSWVSHTGGSLISHPVSHPVSNK
jgi:hypothetical protein